MAPRGDRRCAYGILVLRPERTNSFGRPRHSLEDNIKMDLQGVVWGSMD